MDFEMGNQFTATHPGSVFVNRLMLRAFTPEGRVSVMNRDLTVRRGDKTHSTRLADRSELRALLADAFGFDLPQDSIKNNSSILLPRSTRPLAWTSQGGREKT